MSDWLAALSSLRAAGTPAVLVTVIEANGSTPREAGAKMVVTRDAIHDTIGGGHLELKAIALARDLLREVPVAPAPRAHRFALGPSLGQCCGGEAVLLLEPILPPAFEIAIFGAGHIGKALVKLLADLPARVTWIDAREEMFPAELPDNVTTILAEEPIDEVARLPANAFVLVMTHSHAVDQRIVEAALRRADFRYVGLIGSATKRVRFLRRLAARGLGEAELARLTCPIGVPGAGGKHPAEIAIAVAAQLLQVRDAASAAPAEPAKFQQQIIPLHLPGRRGSG